MLTIPHKLVTITSTSFRYGTIYLVIAKNKKVKNNNDRNKKYDLINKVDRIIRNWVNEDKYKRRQCWSSYTDEVVYWLVKESTYEEP